MSKHTPGPWVRKNGNPTFVPLRAHHCEKLGFSIGFVSLDDNDGCGEPAANARLIAAAPELLEALKDCSEYLSDIPESAVGGDDEAGRINRRAIAAIAKATGEKQ